MSIAQWIMNADNTGPVTIDGTGEGPHDGMYDTAAKMNVVYEFKNPDWTLGLGTAGRAVQNDGRRYRRCLSRR